MVSSSRDDSDTLFIDFLNATALASLTIGNFLTKPNNDAPTSIGSINGSQMVLEFGVDISAETELQMVGAAAGFVVPTTVPIT